MRVCIDIESRAIRGSGRITSEDRTRVPSAALDAVRARSSAEKKSQPNGRSIVCNGARGDSENPLKLVDSRIHTGIV
jgi:hypothetical protein